MFTPLFETERLRCRRWRPEDLDTLYAVYSDREAMRWVGDGEPITLSECEEWFKVTEANYAKRGYGMFALESRLSKAVIGFCGLVHPGGQAEPEVKYAFLREHWGAGLASEAVPALLAYAATHHHLVRIIATVAPENLASQRVLSKAGMRLAHPRENSDGSLTNVYEWLAPSAV
jgi:ribosomal-protein-alanine N-acetyltransferase